MIESIITAIIVGGAILYCGISLKKIITGQKHNCSSGGCNGCSCEDHPFGKS